MYGGVDAQEWKHLDVQVSIAPHSALALNLYSEGPASGEPPVPISNLRISKMRLGYTTYADGSSNLEAHMATIEAEDTRPDAVNRFRRCAHMPCWGYARLR